MSSTLRHPDAVRQTAIQARGLKSASVVAAELGLKVSAVLGIWHLELKAGRVAPLARCRGRIRKAYGRDGVAVEGMAKGSAI